MKVCHSEEEACAMWCPFARQTTILVEDAGLPAVVAATNRSPKGVLYKGCLCIASQCMAWRWVRTNVRDPDGGNFTLPCDDQFGYCGLAGKGD
jgi:hypothetical protein